MAVQDVERSGGTRRAATAAWAGPTVEFAFGAVFTSIRVIPLRAGRGESLAVTDLLPCATGRLWIADAPARALKIYSQQGWRLRTLDRDDTGLRRPVSLTSLHGRWVAALDGLLPAIVILDESGRPLRRFPLPELDRPVQVCGLGERRLAVAGSGWGRGAGKLVHIYTTHGDHVESLLGEPRDARPGDRVHLSAIGDLLYIGHSRTDSFAIHDLEGHAVFSFPSVTARIAERLGRDIGFAGALRGLFATACGPLLAVYSRWSAGRRDYLYDLYGLDGTPIALGTPSGERVLGVEGSLYYSVRRAPGGGDATLRIWRLSRAA